VFADGYIVRDGTAFSEAEGKVRRKGCFLTVRVRY